ncbi:cysteine desulfurase-like protein [Anaerolineales bacterium]
MESLHFMRERFPSLKQQGPDGNPYIFFDNPAGTQVPQSVIDAVSHYYETMNANYGGYFITSQRNDVALASARQRVADFINAPRADEIVFGPNMTTLNFALSRAIARTLSPNSEIVVTRLDHDANIRPWVAIAEDLGLKVRWVDIRESDCMLDLSSLEAALTEQTRIVATVHASNAVGTINPTKQITEMAHAVGALSIVDAVQSAPHIPLDVQELGCDFLLCSAYKFYGPHIGIMWGRYDLLADLPVYKLLPSKDIPPYRWETGTLSFETIAGVRAAIDHIADCADDRPIAAYTGDVLVLKQAMHRIQDYEQMLAHKLADGLEAIPGVQIIGIRDRDRFAYRVPTIAFEKEGITPAAIAQELAKHHIFVWNGNYYAVEIMKRLNRVANGLVRVGLAQYNTEAEIDRFLNVVESL